MTTVSRTFNVASSPDVVIAYLQDFSHAEEWDPGTESCARLDDGPVRVGSQWRNRSTDTITVTPNGRGGEVTYEAVIEMRGVPKLTAPLVKLVFEKVGNDTEKRLTSVLNQLPR